MSEKYLIKQDKPVHVCCSLMSWIPLQSREAVVVEEMLEVQQIESSINYSQKWMVSHQRRVYSSLELPIDQKY